MGLAIRTPFLFDIILFVLRFAIVSLFVVYILKLFIKKFAKFSDHKATLTAISIPFGLLIFLNIVEITQTRNFVSSLIQFVYLIFYSGLASVVIYFLLNLINKIAFIKTPVRQIVIIFIILSSIAIMFFQPNSHKNSFTCNSESCRTSPKECINGKQADGMPCVNVENLE